MSTVIQLHQTADFSPLWYRRYFTDVEACDCGCVIIACAGIAVGGPWLLRLLFDRKVNPETTVGLQRERIMGKCCNAWLGDDGEMGKFGPPIVITKQRRQITTCLLRRLMHYDLHQDQVAVMSMLPVSGTEFRASNAMRHI